MVLQTGHISILLVILGIPGLASAQWESDRPAGRTPPERFPYQAFVINDGASVHSGPAAVHYATDELVVDSVVDVHRHDPGGWCAIRPPQDSFSLVPASAVDLIDDHLGKVHTDGVQVWVGTLLGAVEHPLSQVKLKADELVKILGEVSWPDPQGHSTTWYQIAPPPGEFRWIKISDIRPPKRDADLSADLSADLAAERRHPPRADRIESSVNGANDRLAAATYLQQQTQNTRLEPPSQQDARINQGWKKATSPIRVADRRSDINPIEPFKIPAIAGPGKADPVARRNRNSTLPSRLKFANDSPVADRTNSASSITSIYNQPLDPLSGTISQRVALLESSLTNEMIKAPSQWNLEPILKQATQISTASSNATERQHADRLIQKIRQCVGIQTNFEDAYQTYSVEQTLNGTVGSGLDNQVQLGTRYDAHGWLNQLVRRKGNVDPTYVLENKQGQIIFHIGAAPGLNLHRYLKQRVGISGRRGYHRELKMNHITAERVVPLEPLKR